MAAPTVKDGAPESVEFDQGQSTPEIITLSGVFAGQNLEFSAESSDVAVATASIASGTLIITAVSSGTASITVTATNAGGSEEHRIAVTIPEPPTEPTEPESMGPTVKEDAPDAVEFDQGQTTRTVTLSRVFEEENLTYSDPESDTPTVATASISSGILIIRAGSPGDATITVTATDAGGKSASHEITVTVPEPVTTTPEPTPPTSATLTIKLGESAKRTLSADQTLRAPAGGGVRVEPSPDGETGNVWLITALKKGTHTISIFSGSATPEKVGSIVVEVPNSPPVRKHNIDHPASVATTPTENLHTTDTALDLYAYFDDPDNDMLRFRVGSKPSWVLIDSKDGFVKTTDDDGTPAFEATGLMFEVLETPTVDDFTVSIYAVDDSGGESLRPVVLTFSTTDMSPRVRTYEVTQGSNGALNIDGALKVGPRLAVSHTVTFDDTDSGFVFAEDESDKLEAAGRLSSHTVTTTSSHVKNQDGTHSPPLPDESTPPSSGTDYFIIESTGAVVLDGSTVTLSGADPSVTFQLKKGSSGSIVIRYIVWAQKSSTDTSTSKNSYQRSLSVNVVTCNSPPDELSDCP